MGSRDKALENFGYFAFWISSKHGSRGSATTNGDESLHEKSTLLRVWGSEFGIPSRYTGFKIALDTALTKVRCYVLERFCTCVKKMLIRAKEGLKPATLLKGDSNTDVFPEIYKIFKNISDGCFWKHRFEISQFQSLFLNSK